MGKSINELKEINEYFIAKAVEAKLKEESILAAWLKRDYKKWYFKLPIWKKILHNLKLYKYKGRL